MNFKEVLASKYPNGLPKERAKSIASSIKSISIKEDNKESGTITFDIKAKIDISDAFEKHIETFNKNEDILEAYEDLSWVNFKDGDLEKEIYNKIRGSSDVNIDSCDLDHSFYSIDLPALESKEESSKEEIIAEAIKNLKSVPVELKITITYSLSAEYRTKVEKEIEEAIKKQIVAF